MKSLGKELKNAREFKSFSLRQVEEVTGISNAYLSQLENDKIKKPAANILYKLSKMYGLDFNLLLVTAGVIEEEEDNKMVSSGAQTLSGSYLAKENLSKEEEELLAEYLKFIRFQKK